MTQKLEERPKPREFKEQTQSPDEFFFAAVIWSILGLILLITFILFVFVENSKLGRERSQLEKREIHLPATLPQQEKARKKIGRAKNAADKTVAAKNARQKIAPQKKEQKEHADIDAQKAASRQEQF